MMMALMYVLGFLLVVAVFDILQRKRAIVHNFPIIGHLRYILESVGPELRQYIVTSNNEERPFNRDQRRWIYASSKKQNNYFAFGTDNDLELSPNYLIIKHTTFPLSRPEGYSAQYPIPCVKILGGARKRKKAFRPESVINISAMSYGALGATAVEALNRGCRIIGCLQNTGEGGVSKHHLHGAGIIWQIGTGYFGCRDEKGKFSFEKFKEKVKECPTIKAIEIKLSQGAKPGLGGVLPATKITEEISKIRGVPMGVDCVSPPYHTAFHDEDSLLDFVEKIADETGLPVGIKSAVGNLEFWKKLAKLMQKKNRGVDFITIDGSEGGTGAGPLAFVDHVSLPFKIGMSRVFPIFAEAGIQNDIVFIGSGKLGFPEQFLLARTLGCDMINVAREAMMSIGCIQAQRCHTGHCPTGVATQVKWLMNGLDPTLKSARLANYIVTLRKDIMNLCWAIGKSHPALVDGDDMEIVGDGLSSVTAAEHFKIACEWLKQDDKNIHEVIELMGKHAVTVH